MNPENKLHNKLLSCSNIIFNLIENKKSNLSILGHIIVSFFNKIQISYHSIVKLRIMIRIYAESLLKSNKNRLQIFEIFPNCLANWTTKLSFHFLLLQHHFITGLTHHQMTAFAIHHLRLSIEAYLTLFQRILLGLIYLYLKANYLLHRKTLYLLIRFH